MKSRNNARKQFILAVLLLAGASSAKTAMAAAPAMYAVDFVSSAATGYAMNDQGMVVGVRSKLPPGCTPATCLGVSEAVVWAGDTVTPLPLLPGFATVTAISINAGGWVAGFAGDPTSTGGRAVVWKPSGAGYAVIDLGVLPGTSVPGLRVSMTMAGPSAGQQPGAHSPHSPRHSCGLRPPAWSISRHRVFRTRSR